ncbi:uncharacterized protein Tco_1462361, partial [Tanacetum coccineum]
MIKENLQKAKDLLDNFYACIEKRTVLSGVQLGNWGLKEQSQAKFPEPQLNQNGTSVNTKFVKPSTSGNKLYLVNPFPKHSLLKIDYEPIIAYFKNKRIVHRDYMKVTKEHVETLQELSEKVRSTPPNVDKPVEELGFILFKCKWIDNRRGLLIDKDGFTTVNLSTNGYVSELFILAKVATQVFYVEDPKDSRWHVVQFGKRHIVGIDNVVDKDVLDLVS